MQDDMIAALDALLDKIADDYVKFSFRKLQSIDTLSMAAMETKRAEFRKDLGYVEGKKYIKITRNDGGSAWGFVVKETAAPWHRGDVLKAASWAAPAQNFARGNVFTKAPTNWTGAL